MSGLDVLIDTNVFVSARNPHERSHRSCQELLDRIDRGELHAVISTVTIAELRAGIAPEEVPTVWKAMISHFQTSPNFQIEPVGSEIAEAAGALRAASRLTLADALVVATGQFTGVSILVTLDQELSRRQAVLTVKSPMDKF